MVAFVISLIFSLSKQSLFCPFVQTKFSLQNQENSTSHVLECVSAVSVLMMYFSVLDKEDIYVQSPLVPRFRNLPSPDPILLFSGLLNVTLLRYLCPRIILSVALCPFFFLSFFCVLLLGSALYKIREIMESIIVAAK